MEILKDIINQGTALLKKADITDAVNDSWLLAEYVFGITKAEFYINPKKTVGIEQKERYFALIKKRASRIPLQHLTGNQEFMGLTFKVNKNVLVPRQDTELLVELAVEYINSLKSNLKVLDMCTGSGCIAVSVDKLCSGVEVTAADISDEALVVAKDNNEMNRANVKFVQSDLFEMIQGKFDLILSNPPYIRTADINYLMEEVKEHEPFIALDGDEDGLKFYRLIAQELNSHLNNDGMIMFEIGYDQGETVPEILKKCGLKDIKVFQDLSGNDRVVTARKE